MKIKAFLLTPGHSFKAKKVRENRLFGHKDGAYMVDREKGVYPVRKERGLIEPISFYFVGDPRPYGANSLTDIATVVWRGRMLEQLSGAGKPIGAMFLKYIFPAMMLLIVAYLMFG